MSEPDPVRLTPPLTGNTGSSGSTGSDALFIEFYRSATRPLVAFLLAQGATLYQAADIVQDTMIHLYRRWAEVHHPRAWAYRTASRALIRALSTVRETPTAELPESSPLVRMDATGVEQWEQQYDLVREFARLPPRQRQVMSWTQAGYSPAEIAVELNLTPEAVRSNLYRARKALIAHRSQAGDAQ